MNPIYQIAYAKKNYLEFIKKCQVGPADFVLTPQAEPTAFARCFAVYGLNLLKQRDMLEKFRKPIIKGLIDGILESRKKYNSAPTDKAYRQLLAFTLSALSIYNSLNDDRLAKLVVEQLPNDVESYLNSVGALKGKAQSGNHAMFIAIFLMHAKKQLGIDTNDKMKHWIRLHILNMNKFGFWGESSKMQHLLFQNGYHQHEILEYLEIKNPNLRSTIKAVQSMADHYGHFAPYPGGGGCYDYDAVFLLTPNGIFHDSKTRNLMQKTIQTLLSEQSLEGGWGESIYIRPRNLKNMWYFILHLARALPNFRLFKERIRYAIALQCPWNNSIKTHWSRYCREWNESNLWDSWFRMMTIARIQIANNPKLVKEWGFINYPGIGFHAHCHAGSDQ